MTFTNVNNNQAQMVKTFRGFNTDEQLALLWYAYTLVGDRIMPSANPSETGMPIAQALYDQIAAASQDDQLKMQREIVASQDTSISRTYGEMNSSAKLSLWYLLAQGIEQGEIIPVLEDFKQSDHAQPFLDQLKGIEFNDQIMFLRSVVLPMGIGSPETTRV